MLLNGRREADILRCGWGDAPDDEGDERAGDGSDEDIDPEGEMAESTEEGCAADWHPRGLLTVGVDVGLYCAVIWIFLCQPSRSGTSGFTRSGVTRVWDIHMPGDFPGSRRRDGFADARTRRFCWDSLG